jgi:hypothetical protein
MKKQFPKRIVERVATDCRNSYKLRREDFLFKVTGSVNTFNHTKMWDGGEYRDKLYTSVWKKMALFMLFHRLKPDVCIKFLFDDRIRRGVTHPTLPTHIATKKNLASLKRVMRAEKGKVGLQLQIEKEICRRFISCDAFDVGMVGEDAVEYALAEAIGLSPLFKYCMAANVGLTDICDDEYEEALLQFSSFPEDYMEHWVAWIPIKLIEDVSYAIEGG